MNLIAQISHFYKSDQTQFQGIPPKYPSSPLLPYTLFGNV